MSWVGARYCWLTVTGKTDPVFATWCVLMVSVCLAFWTYCSTKKRNLIDNIANTVDLIVVAFIIGTISIFGQNVRAGFAWFEIGDLILATSIALFWWRSKDPFTSNLAVQALMVIGYIPLIVRVATANENPEPWSVWIPMWFAGAFAMIPAYLPRRGGNEESGTWEDTILPKVYTTRAFVSVTTVLVLMLWLELQ